MEKYNWLNRLIIPYFGWTGEPRPINLKFSLRPYIIF